LYSAEPWALQRVEISNTQKVLKCGAGEGWIRLFGQTVGEMKKYCKESTRRRISHKHIKKEGVRPAM
jgi:hypothetical protein